MRLHQARAVVVGVAMSWLYLPSTGRAGWITLTSGPSGSAQPVATSEFWYGTLSTVPLLAIDTLSNTGTVQATTGGGTAFFGGLGVPALFDLSDGFASVSGGSLPTGVAARGPGGVPPGTFASAVPRSGGTVSPNYSRLGIVLTAPDASGVQVLTVSVLDGNRAELGSKALVVPDDGWWVLGLGPGQELNPTPPLEPPPVATPEPTSPPSRAPGVPEPATLALAAAGAFAVVPWLRRKSRPVS